MSTRHSGYKQTGRVGNTKLVPQSVPLKAFHPLRTSSSVDCDVAVDGEIGLLPLPEGEYGVGRFWVNASEYSKTWHHMYARWLPGSGYRPYDRFALEHYPKSKLSEDRRLVEIHIPVVKR